MRSSGSIDTVVFDKTGTLTRGEPALERAVAPDGTNDTSFLRTVAAIEQGSDHPIARAIARASPGAPLASGVQYVAGRGVRGSVDGVEVIIGNLAMLDEAGVPVPELARQLGSTETKRGRIVVHAAVGAAFCGTLVLADEVRPEAAASLVRMRASGLRLVMLTGDGKASAADVADRLGIDEVHAELLPEDKLRIVQSLKQQGRRVLFVGDGINDAPALAEAHVGAALQSGTEAAMETADVVLMTNDLSGLGDALRESRRSQRVILFNFGGTLIVDFIGIGLAAFGMIGPLVAAIVHVGSELFFILNSARLFAAIGAENQASVAGGASREHPQPVQSASR